MKIARYEASGVEQIGVVVDGGVISVSGLGFPTVLELISMGAEGLRRVSRHVENKTPDMGLDQVRLLAPIERPGKYLGIGLNYGKHADEASKLGVDAPKYQMWFNKQTTCISGPYDPIEPGVTEQLDYEIELGVVIGKITKGVAASNALSQVFGYVVANDVSARDWQFHSPTHMIGKSFDTYGPIGPWILTADELPDPQNLELRCWVNGELRQSANTSQMIHSIANQIAYLSTAFTLEPGDLIASGTPEGVGIAMDPPQFLKSGDLVRCEIDRIGIIENLVL